MKFHRILIAIPLLFGLSLALLSPGCDKLITEVNNITLIDTTLGKECKSCHTDKDDQLIVVPKGQWQNSAHANASLLEYPMRLNGQLKTATACGPSCHSGNGYVDSVLTGHVSDTTKPSVINCYTCHLPHSVPTEAGSLDSLRGIALAVTLADGQSKYIQGKSNMCANCHRATGAPPTLASGDITLSANFGPHYSAQADVVIGAGGYRFDTGAVVIDVNHIGPSMNDACITCHFGKGRGYDLGEHTFRLQYHDDAHDTTPYIANCNATGCHNKASVTDFYALSSMSDAVPRGDSIRRFADTLRYLLENSFILNPDDTAGTMYTVGDILPADGARILYNYLLYRHDGSRGLHNPRLMNNLLKHSVAKWESIPPRADFVVSDNDVCVGEPVTFTNRTRFTYHSSEWTFGGGGNSTVTSPVYSYPSSGIYSVTLKATNDSTNVNSSATKANAITVHGPLTARIHVVDSTICLSSTITLVDSSLGIPTSQQWYFPDADSTFTGNTVSFHPKRAGEDTVTVVLRAFNSCTPGGDTVVRDIIFSADSTVVAEFGWTPTSINTNTLVQFVDNSTGGPQTWNWMFILSPDTTRVTGQSPSFTFLTAGTYTAVLIVSNSCTTDTTSHPVQVTPPPPPAPPINGGRK